MAELLIKNGADVNSLDNNHKSALHRATLDGNLYKINQLEKCLNTNGIKWQTNLIDVQGVNRF